MFGATSLIGLGVPTIVEDGEPAIAGFVAVLALLFAATAVRALRAGLWVEADVVTVRSMIRTQRVPIGEVQDLVGPPPGGGFPLLLLRSGETLKVIVPDRGSVFWDLWTGRDYQERMLADARRLILDRARSEKAPAK